MESNKCMPSIISFLTSKEIIFAAMITVLLFFVINAIYLKYKDEPFEYISQQDNSSQPTTDQQIQKKYKKYELITKPSNLDPQTGGYISRDFVCYRYMLSDQDFVKKRPYCMACQVDTSDSPNSQNRGGTGTNVISTCVYGDDKSEQQCREQCAALN